jgi:hypothetical protein
MAADISNLKKIAEGREAEMFEWEGGRVLRLYREGEGIAAPQQARLLELARNCGVRVPREYGTAIVGKRTGFVMERIPGPDLLQELGAKPWRLLQIGGIWGRLQAGVNSRHAPPEVPPAALRYRNAIERSTLIPADLKEAALKQLECAPDGDRLLHGDFHPANIMRGGDELVIIDWANIMRGPAEADYYRSYMICTLGDLPPGTPALLRLAARIGRRVLRGAFVRSYRRTLKLDESVIEAWRLPVIAARIGEGIGAEFPALLRLARQLIGDKRPGRP